MQGFCKKQLTPNYRGFDSFFGFYLTKQDHFSHIGKKNAYDFRTNLDVNTSLAVQGKYSTHIYSEEVRRLVREYKVRSAFKRERDRQTDRQTGTERDREGHRRTDIQTDR